LRMISGTQHRLSLTMASNEGFFIISEPGFEIYFLRKKNVPYRKLSVYFLGMLLVVIVCICVVILIYCATGFPTKVHVTSGSSHLNISM
ncbi:hypothetical protein L9F63_008769, partial [Diploptera punctata]